MLVEQYIVFTDTKGFTQFVQSSDIERVEGFLIECDDLINRICEKYNGTIRQVNGDQYFITFLSCEKAIDAVQELGISWRHMAESYDVGLSVGVHKGSLNVVRSYVYGEDIHITVFLSELQRLYRSGAHDVWIVISAKIEEELRNSKWEAKLQKLDDRPLTQDRYKLFSRQGVYRLLLDG